MPISLNLDEIMAEAKHRFKTARVSPWRMTALMLLILMGLNLAGVLVDSVLPAPTDALPFRFTFFDVLIMLISSVLNAGLQYCCLRFHRGEELPYDSLFDAVPSAGRVVLLDVLFWILVGVGLSLFILPGLYLLLTYSLARFYLLDDPQVGAVEALRRSRAEMTGRRWQMLRLILRFFPLLLLGSGVLMFSQQVLARSLPNTLAGNLLFTLIHSLLMGCVEVFLTPLLRLAQAGFYDRARAGRSDEPPFPL